MEAGPGASEVPPAFRPLIMKIKSSQGTNTQCNANTNTYCGIDTVTFNTYDKLSKNKISAAIQINIILNDVRHLMSAATNNTYRALLTFNLQKCIQIKLLYTLCHYIILQN